MSRPRFTGELLSPTDPGYDDACRLWNAMIDKRPARIARCRSTTDVATAVAEANDDRLEISVRCG